MMGHELFAVVRMPKVGIVRDELSRMVWMVVNFVRRQFVVEPIAGVESDVIAAHFRNRPEVVYSLLLETLGSVGAGSTVWGTYEGLVNERNVSLFLQIYSVDNRY